MNNHSRTEELLERHIDQIASDADLAELCELIAASPEAADLFARTAVLDSALTKRCESQQTHSIPLPVVRPRWRRRFGWLSAAAVLMALLGSWWYLGRPDDTGKDAENRVAEVESGRVMIDDQGQIFIPPSGRVEVPVDESAVLKMVEGSRVELSPTSVAILHGKVGDAREVVELIQGEGKFRVQKGQGRFQVQTVAGNVTALGTEFSVGLRLPERAKDDRKKTMPVWVLEVEVSEGSVEVETWREKVRLVAPVRRVFETERAPDVKGLVQGIRRSKGTGFIDIEVQAADGPAQIRTLRMVRTTRMNKDGSKLIGRPAAVWLEVSSADTAAWIVGE